MDLFHKLIDLVDKNSSMIPEGDYLELCDTIKQLRDKVKPPSFLLNQNIPMTLGDETIQGPPTYIPTPVGQPYDWMDENHDTVAQRESIARDDEEDRYPGLNQFIQELDTEWAEHTEPGSYYPPPRQTMMDID